MNSPAADRSLVKDEIGAEAYSLVSELMLQSNEQTLAIEQSLMKSLENENDELKKTVVRLKKIIWKIENHFMSLFQEDEEL